MRPDDALYVRVLIVYAFAIKNHWALMILYGDKAYENRFWYVSGDKESALLPMVLDFLRRRVRNTFPFLVPLVLDVDSTTPVRLSKSHKKAVFDFLNLFSGKALGVVRFGECSRLCTVDDITTEVCI